MLFRSTVNADDLGDVTVSSPLLGQIMAYDGTVFRNTHVIQANSADTGAPIPLLQRNVAGNGLTFGAQVRRKSTNSALSSGTDGTGISFAVDNGNSTSSPQVFGSIDGVYSTSAPTMRLRVTANNGSTYTTGLTVSPGRTSMNLSMRLANYTTTQRDALTSLAGDMIFNTDNSRAQCYNGTTWNDLW